VQIRLGGNHRVVARMSGRPHTQGVANVVALSRECATLEKECDELTARIDADQRRLKAIGAELTKKSAERHLQMAKMDLVHSGNFGFEARLSAFLTMLADATGTPVSQPPKE
jgi:hypothetical protein